VAYGDEPTAFTASIVTRRSAGYVTEPMVTLVSVVTHSRAISASSQRRTRKKAIASPPVFPGAQLTVDEPTSFTTDSIEGASGTVAGVTAALASLGVEDPNDVCAVTRAEYAVPFASPVNRQCSKVVSQTCVPGSRVTVYPEMLRPPDSFAVQ
jgi:hypothetical protein